MSLGRTSRHHPIGHVPTLVGEVDAPSDQRGPSCSAPFLLPTELPSVMLLNGDCPESLKKEEGPPEPPQENGLDEAEPGEETTGQEVIVIQDTGFSVKILAPGIEPFSLQVRCGEELETKTQVSWGGQGWEDKPCLCSSWPHVVGRRPTCALPTVTQLDWWMWGSGSRHCPIAGGQLPAGTIGERYVVAGWWWGFRAPSPLLCTRRKVTSLAVFLPFA